MTILLYLCTILPFKIKRLIYNKFFMWDISENAFIGFSFINARHVKMESGSIIKSGTVIKGLDLVLLKTNARLGTLNWVSGHRKAEVPLSDVMATPSSYSVLIIGNESAVTNRHYIDCTSAILIGNYTTIAGVKSTFMTHSIDIYASKQGASCIEVGDFCFIGSDCTVLGGSSIPNFSVVGAKALVNKKLEKTYSLYGGVPATHKKFISEDTKYFKRKVGVVD